MRIATDPLADLLFRLGATAQDVPALRRQISAKLGFKPVTNPVDVSQEVSPLRQRRPKDARSHGQED